MSRVGLPNPGSATGPNGGLVIRDLTVAYGRRVVLHGVSAEITYVPQREAVDWAFPVTVREVVMMGRYPHLA